MGFDFEDGQILNKKYRVQSKIGMGWEGEVYSIEELNTGVIRAAKFFYPRRNRKNKTVINYAKKLNKLSDTPVIIKYISQEEINFSGKEILFLVSEYIDAYSLESYIKSFKGDKIQFFEALHIFYQLVKGIEHIHSKDEFHGDLHSENILIRKKGLSFEIKLIDLFMLKGSKRDFQRADIIDLIDIFYKMLGGPKNYSKLPMVAKKIICGRNSSLVLKKFPRISVLKGYLENLDWC